MTCALCMLQRAAASFIALTATHTGWKRLLTITIFFSSFVVVFVYFVIIIIIMFALFLLVFHYLLVRCVCEFFINVNLSLWASSERIVEKKNEEDMCSKVYGFFCLFFFSSLFVHAEDPVPFGKLSRPLYCRANNERAQKQNNITFYDVCLNVSFADEPSTLFSFSIFRPFHSSLSFPAKFVHHIAEW